MRRKRKPGPTAILSYAERQENARIIQEKRAKEEREYELMMLEREKEFAKATSEYESEYDSDDDDRDYGQSTGGEETRDLGGSKVGGSTGEMEGSNRYHPERTTDLSAEDRTPE